MSSATPDPVRAPTPFPPHLARTLYNVVDALGVEDREVLVGLAPVVERALRHRGLGAARRAWLALRVVEWRPLVAWPPGASFSRRSREDRRHWLGRLEAGPLARAVDEVRGLLAEAGVDQSSSGA